MDGRRSTQEAMQAAQEGTLTGFGKAKVSSLVNFTELPLV
jgi:hypothetical protein